MDLPRTPLVARFGELLVTRLDQALGAAHEPLSPRMPVPAMLATLPFADPIGDSDMVARATDHLLADLCTRLEEAHLGARRLVLRAYRVDGHIERVIIGTSRPSRTPTHLKRLLAEKLEEINPGFGVDVMTLAATVVEQLSPQQAGMTFAEDHRQNNIGHLVDHLSNRIGADHVIQFHERASHLPERVCQERPALAVEPAAAVQPSPEADDHRSQQPRPIHLLPSPEPIDVIAAVPDGPPAMVRWRHVQHRIIAAEGPERISPEWWREDDGHTPEKLSQNRDYYLVENTDGHRLWLYREGLYRPDRPPRWYLHGLFA
jgi:protein ImuB